MVEDRSAESPFEVAATALLPEEINRLLAPLDEREREILKLRFGLDRGEPRTLEEVGEHFNLTRERIRQIEARAMSKLRHPRATRALATCWPSDPAVPGRPMADDARPWRVAELTVALSLATDLGTGQPMEHGLRTCWLSLAVAQALGLREAELSCVYYVALLRFVGCTSGASDIAAVAGGNDVAFNVAMAPVLMAQPGEGLRPTSAIWPKTRPCPAGWASSPERSPIPGSTRAARQATARWRRLARRLGLDGAVCDSLAHAFERWDGKGHPSGLAGEEVPVAVRVVAAARDAELFGRSGWPTAVEVLIRRRGQGYDPAVVALVDGGEGWLGDVGDDPCAQVLDAEPAPARTVRADELDTAQRHRRLRRPQVALVPWALDRRGPPRRGGGAGRGHWPPMRDRSAARRSSTTSARSACRAGSGIALPGSRPSSGSASGCIRT